MRPETKCLLIGSIAFVAIVLFISQGFVFSKSLVSGTSMYPTINNGDTVWCLTILPQNLTGQIVSYQNGTINILHRVVEDHGNIIVTKGDNNPVVDPWTVYRSSVIGYAVCVLPWYGRILDIIGFFGICLIGVVVVWRIK